MRILVIAGKQVGSRCLDFLLRRHATDDYTILWCDEESARVARAAGPDRARAHAYAEDTLHTLNALPEAHFDWLLNLWGSHILRQGLLSRCRRTLNIHPSLLPVGRGRDPVVWALRRGEPAGVTLHSISNEVDAGPLWYQEEISYSWPITGAELYARVVDTSAAIFCAQWPTLRTRQKPPVPQSNLRRANRRQDLLADRLIRPTDPAEVLINKALAHDFGANYCAQIDLDGQRYKVRLLLEPLGENKSKTA